ncbi:MAG: aminomethyl transferase family protein [Deltaproteobacteria bacterium]|nr:aminomethyl transferase family protein [Deltaproteobacteria bacterium]
MGENVKSTPLIDWHRGHGANMSVFGGYEMPLWYGTGAKTEHCSVLTAAGLFDTSHMAVITLSGSDAFDLLQYCFTKDLTSCIGKNKGPLVPGRCVYGIFLDPEGCTIDDAIVYRLDETDYMIVVNAGMGVAITAHLSANRSGRSVIITDLTDQVGKVDIQGPASGGIMKMVLENPGDVLREMPYFSFKGRFDKKTASPDAPRMKDGRAFLLSRTGYTGEFGFELFMERDHLLDLWEMLLDAGMKQGMITCGLAARDSLRAGAVLPLSHQDIGAWPFARNPWLFALPHKEDAPGFTKDFIGAEALQNTGHADHTYPFAGFDLRKVSVGDPARVYDREGREIGTVLTCATDMGIDRVEGRIYSIASPEKPEGFSPRGLCCGFVKVNRRLDPEERIHLRDKRRSIEVMIATDVRPDRTARRPLGEML